MSFPRLEELMDSPMHSAGLAAVVLVALLPGGCSSGSHHVVEPATVATPGAFGASLHAHPGGCRGCHEGMGATAPSGPPRDGVCVDCHTTLSDDLEKQHGPFLLADCRTCHAPHTALYPGLAHSAQPRLCQQCHETLFSCPSMGKPALESACTSCHGSHGGTAPFILRRDFERSRFDSGSAGLSGPSGRHIPATSR